MDSWVTKAGLPLRCATADKRRNAPIGTWADLKVLTRGRLGQALPSKLTFTQRFSRPNSALP